MSTTTKKTKSTPKPKLAAVPAAPKVQTDFPASCASAADKALRERTPLAVGTALAYFTVWAADMKRRGLGENDEDEGPMPFNVAERVVEASIASAVSMGEISLAAGLSKFIAEAIEGISYRENEDMNQDVTFLIALTNLTRAAGEAASNDHHELSRYRAKAAQEAEVAVAARVAKIRAEKGGAA